MKALVEEKMARTPTQKKIASQLLYAKAGKFAQPKPGAVQKGQPAVAEGAVTKISSLLEMDADGRVLVDIKGDVGGGLQRKIEDVNGTVVAISEAHGSARAWLALSAMEPLASQSIVRAIRPAFQARTARTYDPRVPLAKQRDSSWPLRVAKVQASLQQALAAPGDGVATNVGSVTSGGDSGHQADRARKFYNTNGSGVKVGVLSDSDDGKENAIALGDLRPDTVTVPGESGRPGSGEGTAMMEIVQDLAPGAQLFFATAFTSPESFADNIRRLRFEFGCDIIVDDVIYFFESPYQDDIIAQAVNDVIADGALYMSSAGNEGNFSDGTSGTWEGDFRPAGTLATLPAGYTVHDFDLGSKVISNRVELDGGPLILHWSDPGTLDLPQSSNDYDLFVLDEDLRNVLVAATDVQDGDDLPFEFLGFLIPPDLRIVVARNPGAQTRAIYLAHFRGELGLATPNSIFGHAAAHDAMAVAAVDAAEAVGGVFVAGPTTPVELFSSDGDRRVFYRPNGTKFSSGVTFASGGGEFRQKPEITGADGVPTTLPPGSGLNPFFGTSAAAPHVAGVAALMKSAVPSNGNFRNRNALMDSALDIEAQGRDRDSGHGVANAMGALAAAGAKPAVFLERGTVTQSPASINPGGAGTLTIQLLNNGGANATAVSATLATSTPGVTVTAGSSAYPNLPAGGSGSNVTPYAFSVGAAVPCGTLLQFTLTATYTGNGPKPVSFPVTVQTGAANPVPVVTSFTGPRAAIPDSNAAGVNIPLAVAGVGNLARMVFSIDGTTCTSAIGATTVGLDHTWVGDLRAVLTSPGGTSVVLFSRPGGTGNSGNNFCQTVLDDSAASSIQSILISGAPYVGTFRPANPLSALNGQNADGVWNLNVSDNALIDTGGVRAFSLRASGFVCTP